jgi:hypothetical protein
MTGAGLGGLFGPLTIARPLLKLPTWTSSGTILRRQLPAGQNILPGDVKMPPELPQPETYLKKLEDLKTVFPAPLSNPVLDGYVVHTVSRFLDLVDDMKSSAPLLGKIRLEH